MLWGYRCRYLPHELLLHIRRLQTRNGESRPELQHLALLFHLHLRSLQWHCTQTGSRRRREPSKCVLNQRRRPEIQDKISHRQ